VDDGPELSDVLQENRCFLAPWQPLRPEQYYTAQGQRDAIERLLEQQSAGMAVPLAIADDSGAIVGAITLQLIIRGAFQSCSVGYWLAEAAQGQGLATRALQEATALAFRELRLHRVQADTLAHNHRSQEVLKRVGFVPCGEAASYLYIAERWQDHLLFQLVTPTPERVVIG
jgi:ribosomal-protein-alanine N-acetyltransferase